MARPGFYNENVNRAFPFQLGTVAVYNAAANTIEAMANWVVADCGFIVGYGSGFVPGQHSIWLQTIKRIGNEIIFSFESDAPGLYANSLDFTRQITDPDFTTSNSTDLIDVPYVEQHSDSLPNPDPTTRCFFLGKSGVFSPPRTGRLRFFFNDSFFPDNTGSFTLVFNGVTYAVPCTIDGIVGPKVIQGYDYHYSATGTIMYRPHTDPANDQHATPEGDTKNPMQIAPSTAPCPGLRYYGLTAKLLEDNPEYSETYHVSESSFYPSDALWDGYLVTGSMALLANAIADGQQWNRSTGGLVEPALIQCLDGAYMTTLNIANQDRTRVTSPAGCPPLVWAYPTGADRVFTAAIGIAGDIQLTAGFNSLLLLDTINNAITLSAMKGAGAGEPCDDPTLFPGEIPLNAGGNLDGSPACNEVIRTINGVGGQFVSLLNGQGVTITATPADNTLVIDVNMAGMPICYPNEPASEFSENL